MRNLPPAFWWLLLALALIMPPHGMYVLAALYAVGVYLIPAWLVVCLLWKAPRAMTLRAAGWLSRFLVP